MPLYSDSTPRGWLAFELSVLRRLRFRSFVNPFAGEPDLETHVKRWGVRVAANDAARWGWIKGIARVENNALLKCPVLRSNFARARAARSRRQTRCAARKGSRPLRE